MFNVAFHVQQCQNQYGAFAECQALRGAVCCSMGKQAPESLKVIFQYNHQHGTPHFPLLLDGQTAATSPIAIQVAFALGLCCFACFNTTWHICS